MGLLDYLAAHVLLCLVPAFCYRGLSPAHPQETITRYLGPQRHQDGSAYPGIR